MTIRMNKANNRNAFRFNNIRKNIAGSNWRYLITVSNENKHSIIFKTSHYVSHNIYIQHRNLVKNDNIGFKLLYLCTIHQRFIMNFKQLMNSSCFFSCRCSHPFWCHSRRSSKGERRFRHTYLLRHILNRFNEGIQKGGFSWAGTAGYNHSWVFDCRFNRL